MGLSGGEQAAEGWRRRSAMLRELRDLFRLLMDRQPVFDSSRKRLTLYPVDAESQVAGCDRATRDSRLARRARHLRQRLPAAPATQTAEQRKTPDACAVILQPCHGWSRSMARPNRGPHHHDVVTRHVMPCRQQVDPPSKPRIHQRPYITAPASACDTQAPLANRLDISAEFRSQHFGNPPRPPTARVVHDKKRAMSVRHASLLHLKAFVQAGARPSFHVHSAVDRQVSSRDEGCFIGA